MYSFTVQMPHDVHNVVSPIAVALATQILSDCGESSAEYKLVQNHMLEDYIRIKATDRVSKLRPGLTTREACAVTPEEGSNKNDPQTFIVSTNDAIIRDVIKDVLKLSLA